MAELSFTSCVFLAVCTVMILPTGSCYPLVNTSSGFVHGLHLEYDDGESVKDFYVYKGIPYAEPPVGPLRFKAPVAKAPWDGVFQARSYGSSCPQRIADVATFYPEYVVQIPDESLIVDEDCLTLSVFSPFNKSEGSAAVMLWIHGGSFENGQGSGYDASALAARGQVVVVTINYRLNVFGFLCTNDDSSPGNYGLLDQQLALKWVHENIARFGGDPSRVTLFGQSAGGASVSAHLYFNESRPLFHRIAAHSGIYRPGYSYGSAERYSEKAREIGAAVGCASTSTSEELVNCLRELSMDELLATALYVSDKTPAQIFGPVFDGRIFSQTTGHLELQHDIMVLHTSGDGSTGLEVINRILQNKTNPENGITESEWEEFLKLFGNYKASSVAINYEYIDRSIEDANLARMKALVDMFLDTNFLALLPGVLEAVPNASSFHVSVFDHRSTANKQWPNLNQLVPHSEEISYLFGLPFNGSGLGSLFTDEERMLSDRIIKYWSNFAKSGDPNVDPDQTASSGDGLTYWPQYGDTETYLLIGSTNSTVGEGYRRDQVSFWTSFIPSLRLEVFLSCYLPDEGEDSYFSSDGESYFMDTAGPDQPQCEVVSFGESLGFKLTKSGAETLIEVLLFAIVALLVILVLSFGAVLGYKFKGTKTTSKEDVRKMNSSDAKEKRSEVKENEGFEDDSKI